MTTPTNPSARDALKPCPFCGGLDCEVQSEIDFYGSWANVHCSNCRLTGPTAQAGRLQSVIEIGPTRGTLEAEATELWNTRALSAPSPSPSTPPTCP